MSDTPVPSLSDLHTIVAHPVLGTLRPPVPYEPRRAFDVNITVTTFRNLLACGPDPTCLTEHTLSIESPDPELCFLVQPPPKPGRQTIRVLRPGVILRFKLTDKQVSDFLPIGIAFTHCTPTNPMAVPCWTSPVPLVGTPFGNLVLHLGVLQLADELPKPPPHPGAFTCFKFSILIQRIYDGALGLIDPEVENEN